ncbi:MAG TPA: ribosomal protein S18-alanine N-acetyltransferase [Gemmatimonadaceae bacterium]|nr:ribosomal protein S18-alanine N-acetyltransferase [Gemmatimonadaceae bacterium]
MTDARTNRPLAPSVRSLAIRLARRDDVDDIAAIEKRAFSDPWSANSFRALFGNPLVHFALAEEAPAGRIVGYVVAWFVVDEAEIANLAVADDARRAGVGATLLDHAIGAAQQRHCQVVFLEVRESNAAARALYASRGFQVAGRRLKYYRKPVEDALVLRRGM